MYYSIGYWMNVFLAILSKVMEKFPYKTIDCLAKYANYAVKMYTS